MLETRFKNRHQNKSNWKKALLEIMSLLIKLFKILLIIILKWNHLISKVTLSKIGTLNKIKMKTTKLTLLNSRLDKKWLWVKNKESRLKCLKANWKEKWLKMDLLGFLKLKTRAPTWVILTFILNCKIWEKNKIKMKKLIFKINH